MARHRQQAIGHWHEWKQKCALALCCAETRRVLSGFIHARFAYYVGLYAPVAGKGTLAGLIPPADEIWHLFETYYILHPGGAGKSYKNWLFTPLSMRGYGRRQSIEAGASLLLRNVVRDYLAREHARGPMLSIHAPLYQDQWRCNPYSLEDLIPDNCSTSCEVEKNELEKLAEKAASRAFADLARRERVALLAHREGLSLCHPVVVKAAKCGHSILNVIFHKALNLIASEARKFLPADDNPGQSQLACLIYYEVCNLILLWGKSEKSCAALCRLSEERVNCMGRCT